MAGLALPIGLILAQQGIGALSRLMGNQGNSGPASLPNLSTVMQTITSQGATQAAANRSAIRGHGASRRLSAGATSSALAGASIEANRSTAQNLTQVESLRLPIARFKESRFQANRARSDERSDDFANFAGAGLGALGKILLLNNQGLLDSPGEGEGGFDFAQQGAQFGGGGGFFGGGGIGLQQPIPRPGLPPGLMNFIFQNN